METLVRRVCMSWKRAGFSIIVSLLIVFGYSKFFTKKSCHQQLHKVLRQYKDKLSTEQFKIIEDKISNSEKAEPCGESQVDNFEQMLMSAVEREKNRSQLSSETEAVEPNLNNSEKCYPTRVKKLLDSAQDETFYEGDILNFISDFLPGNDGPWDENCERIKAERLGLEPADYLTPLGVTATKLDEYLLLSEWNDSISKFSKLLRIWVLSREGMYVYDLIDSRWKKFAPPSEKLGQQTVPKTPSRYFPYLPGNSASLKNLPETSPPIDIKKMAPLLSLKPADTVAGLEHRAKKFLERNQVTQALSLLRMAVKFAPDKKDLALSLLGLAVENNLVELIKEITTMDSISSEGLKIEDIVKNPEARWNALSQPELRKQLWESGWGKPLKLPPNFEIVQPELNGSSVGDAESWQDSQVQLVIKWASGKAPLPGVHTGVFNYPDPDTHSVANRLNLRIAGNEIYLSWLDEIFRISIKKKKPAAEKLDVPHGEILENNGKYPVFITVASRIQKSQMSIFKIEDSQAVAPQKLGCFVAVDSSNNSFALDRYWVVLKKEGATYLVKDQLTHGTAILRPCEN